MEIERKKQWVAVPPWNIHGTGIQNKDPEVIGLQATDRVVSPECKRAERAPSGTETRPGLTACSQGSGELCPQGKKLKIMNPVPVAQFTGSHGPRPKLRASKRFKSSLTWM